MAESIGKSKCEELWNLRNAKRVTVSSTLMEYFLKSSIFVMLVFTKSSDANDSKQFWLSNICSYYLVFSSRLLLNANHIASVFKLLFTSDHHFEIQNAVHMLVLGMDRYPSIESILVSVSAVLSYRHYFTVSVSAIRYCRYLRWVMTVCQAKNLEI